MVDGADIGTEGMYWIAEFPFVPGLFICVGLDDGIWTTSGPIAGPFDTLNIAIAALKLIRS